MLHARTHARTRDVFLGVVGLLMLEQHSRPCCWAWKVPVEAENLNVIRTAHVITVVDERKKTVTQIT